MDRIEPIHLEQVAVVVGAVPIGAPHDLFSLLAGHWAGAPAGAALHDPGYPGWDRADEEGAEGVIDVSEQDAGTSSQEHDVVTQGDIVDHGAEQHVVAAPFLVEPFE